LDWVIGVYTGGTLSVIQLVGEPTAQFSNPAFGICALAADNAARHMETRRIICDLFFILPPFVDDIN
jgi:hypothetical protein